MLLLMALMALCPVSMWACCPSSVLSTWLSGWLSGSLGPLEALPTACNPHLSPMAAVPCGGVLDFVSELSAPGVAATFLGAQCRAGTVIAGHWPQNTSTQDLGHSLGSQTPLPL